MPNIKIMRSTIERLPAATGRVPVYYFDDVLKGFAVRVSPRGVKAFLVQGYAGGKLHRRSLGRYPAVSPESARRRARDLLDGMAGGDAPEIKRARITVAAALAEWLDVHVAHKLKPRTAHDYRQISAKVLIPALGTLAVADVNRAELAALHHDRRGTPRRANYILAVAGSFFSYAEEAGHRPIDSNPARRIKSFPESRRERFLSQAELSRAGAAISAAAREGEISMFAAAALLLCIYTGARQGEIGTLRWREVDLERRMLMLEDSKTGRRPIFLSQPAVAILAALPRVVGNPHVIAGDRAGEPYKNLRRAWIKVRRRAGLEDVRLHDLRHTFASYGAADSMSLPMIGRLLGHRVPATTARYAHLASDPLVEANDRLGLRLSGLLAGPTRLPVQQDEEDL